jgi:uncharacterized protein YjbI with pentapeptide repeats
LEKGAFGMQIDGIEIKPGANLSGKKLSGIFFNLSAPDLREVNFTNCIIEKCNFSQVNLTGAIFSHSHLKKVFMCDTKLNNAKFESSILNQVDFDTAVLRESTFINAKISYVKLCNTKLSGSNLYKAVFRYCYILKADYHNCTLPDGKNSGLLYRGKLEKFGCINECTVILTPKDFNS